MLGFDSALSNILKGLGHETISIGIPTQSPEQIQDDTFANFKEFTLAYVEKHDQLDENDQILGQINNLNSVDEIEQILRANLDYCDECMLKLYRKFAAGGHDEPDLMCGCGGE